MKKVAHKGKWWDPEHLEDIVELKGIKQHSSKFYFFVNYLYSYHEF